MKDLSILLDLVDKAGAKELFKSTLFSKPEPSFSEEIMVDAIDNSFELFWEENFTSNDVLVDKPSLLNLIKTNSGNIDENK